MASRTLRVCDVCSREITSRYVDVGVVLKTMDPDRVGDTYQKKDTCCPACSVNAAREAIERAWTMPVQGEPTP